jgi:hypothetical protein
MNFIDNALNHFSAGVPVWVRSLPDYDAIRSQNRV